MTQYTFPIIDADADTGTDLEGYLNGLIPALYSNHAGSAVPSYAVASMIWVKTVSGTAHEVYYHDGTDDILLYTVNPTANTVDFGSIAGTGANTYTDNQTIESTTPAYVLEESDGTSTHNQAWWVLDGNVLKLQTRDTDGVLVSTDIAITKGPSGATQYTFAINNVVKLTLNSSGHLVCVGNVSGLGFTDAATKSVAQIGDTALLVGDTSSGEYYHVGMKSTTGDTSMSYGSGTLWNSGSALLMYGPNHASSAYDIKWLANSAEIFHYDHSASALYVKTIALRSIPVALTDGASIAVDMSDTNDFTVTLGGNRTLANPSNMVAGQSGNIIVTQDGTGSRTLAFGSYYKFAGGTAPTLSTAASAVDVLPYYVHSSTSILVGSILDVK